MKSTGSYLQAGHCLKGLVLTFEPIILGLEAFNYM